VLRLVATLAAVAGLAGAALAAPPGQGAAAEVERAALPPPALEGQAGATPDLLAGKWEGTWSSTSNGMSGSLRCTAVKAADGQYGAVFDAVFGKIFTFRSAVTLTVKVDGRLWRFSGQKDLGLLAGGVYTYEGYTDGQEFYSTYESRFDKGVFRMKRVGAAGPPAPAP